MNTNTSTLFAIYEVLLIAYLLAAPLVLLRARVWEAQPATAGAASGGRPPNHSRGEGSAAWPRQLWERLRRSDTHDQVPMGRSTESDGTRSSSSRQAWVQHMDPSGPHSATTVGHQRHRSDNRECWGNREQDSAQGVWSSVYRNWGAGRQKQSPGRHRALRRSDSYSHRTGRKVTGRRHVSHRYTTRRSKTHRPVTDLATAHRPVSHPLVADWSADGRAQFVGSRRRWLTPHTDPHRSMNGPLMTSVGFLGYRVEVRYVSLMSATIIAVHPATGQRIVLGSILWDAKYSDHVLWADTPARQSLVPNGSFNYFWLNERLIAHVEAIFHDRTQPASVVSDPREVTANHASALYADRYVQSRHHRA
ncbi:hypothetical protein [Haloglycomyces albus]|uniref:hypothetical protein n=1 Tax=Haloglycomyces albus TaxID=526067 RepID=UPI0004BC2F16|nr:hypothetical protein [Haloglycomyces albus]